MRRLLSIVHGPVFGGGYNQLIRLADPLRDRGWETLVGVPDLPEAAHTLERLRDGGVSAYQFELHRLRRTPDIRVQAAFLLSFRREVGRLRGLIRLEQVDLVQAFGDTNPHAALAGRLESRPVVWHLYDTVTPPPVRRITMPVVRRVADVVMTTGQELARAYPGAELLNDRCIAVYPPVDTSSFRTTPERRAAARHELGLPPDALVVGTVGVRNPTKGHAGLVEAVARLRGSGVDVWCRVLGAPSPVHAPEMEAVDRRVVELGLDDRVAFRDPGNRVAELLPAFDIFVLSSVPRSEGMPTVILEAMASSLPVVSTDVGAVREVVEHGKTGFVVPPLDPAALTDAIGLLAADGALREKLGNAGYVRCTQQYDIGRIADVYAEAYELATTHAASRG